MKGLDAARALYLEKGAELIHTRFPEFEMRIAVGLAGAGSQCLGFDDDVSHDHDFEPGFCLWLTDADDDAIGLALSREMRGLFGGKVSKSSALGTSGVGVMRISDFYRRFTGCSGAPEAWRDWLHLPSYALAQAVSGEVFRDDLGEFSRIRNEIAHGMPGCAAQKACRTAGVHGAVGAVQLLAMPCARRGGRGDARRKRVCEKHGRGGVSLKPPPRTVLQMAAARHAWAGKAS